MGDLLLLWMGILLFVLSIGLVVEVIVHLLVWLCQRR